MTTPSAFQLVAFQQNAFQIATPPSTLSGPAVITTLTNKKSGPFLSGKRFSKKEYFEVLGEVGKDAIKATAVPDGLSELQIAELKLERAQKAHEAAVEGKYNTARTEPVFLKAKEAVKQLKLRNEVDAAKEILRQRIRDAVAKKRGK